jgi:hypothetical protein
MKAATGVVGRATAFLLLATCVYQLTKVPIYINWALAGPPARGMETSASLGWLLGYRGRKLYADPGLFLAPHTLMGCTLLALWASTVLGRVSLRQASQVFFPLATAFGLHALPLHRGLPDRVLGCEDRNALSTGAFCDDGTWPVNETSVGACIVCALIGWASVHYLARSTSAPRIAIARSLLELSWGLSLVAILYPPVDEAVVVAKRLAGSALEGEWIVPEGDAPSPDAGRGWYATHVGPGCPACAVAPALIVGVVCAAALWYTQESDSLGRAGSQWNGRGADPLTSSKHKPGKPLDYESTTYIFENER